MNTATAKYVSGKMRHELRAGKNTVFADVTEETGGEDSGPSPHDLLAMSLAACTAITLRMYAERKTLPMNVEVTVDIEKTEEATTLVRKLKFSGNLDNTQLDRLMDIANHCPIHKVLSGKINIKTTREG